MYVLVAAGVSVERMEMGGRYCEFTHHKVRGMGKNPESEIRGFLPPSAERVVLLLSHTEYV